MNEKRANPLIKLVILVFVTGALLVAFRFSAAQEFMRRLIGWIGSQGHWAPVCFVLLYTLATVLLIPGFILTLGAGFLFGVVKGSLVVSLAAILGATAAFLVSRYFVRARVAREFEQDARFQAIDEAVAEEGWRIVALLRLCPIIPFNFLNYLLGITKVSLGDYFLASLVGMLPATVLFVYVGSLAGDLASLGVSERKRTPAEWTFYGIGLVATLLLTIYLTRLSQRALRRHLPPRSNHAPDPRS